MFGVTIKTHFTQKKLLEVACAASEASENVFETLGQWLQLIYL